MNLPEYRKRYCLAIDEFRADVNIAHEKLEKALASADEAFFEDQSELKAAEVPRERYPH